MEDDLATHRWVNSLPFRAFFPCFRWIILPTFFLYCFAVRYYLAWPPGDNFQKVAREGLQSRLEYANVPFDTVMNAIVSHLLSEVDTD
jgi:hypothetical protein